MTIEIRELLIKATVQAAPQPAVLPPQALEQIKRQLLAECRARLLEQLGRAEPR